MTKRLKWSITTITLFVLAVLCFMLGITTTKNATASAAEVEPEAAAVSSGWYLTGNGAGVLKGNQWTIEQEDRLTGTALDSQNYLGVWHTSQVLMYQGDQFKFVYQPSNLWQDGYYADYRNLEASGAFSYFVDGGNYNLQPRTSGYYIFSLTVAKNQSGNLIISLYADLVSTDVPEITLFEMYVVGNVPYYPTCQWSSGGDSGRKGVPMTYDAETNIWSTETIYLYSTGGFKIHNVVTRNYYPGGENNQLYAPSSGWYSVQWKQGETSPYLVSETKPATPETTMTPGWYLFGTGAASLKPSWFHNFVPSLYMSGSSSMNCRYQNYYGSWSIEVTLYRGDQFKVLYNDGTFTNSSDYKWNYYFVANSANVKTQGLFTKAGADYNIQVQTSGKYTITISPHYDSVYGVSLYVYASLDSTDVEPIPTFDMYVVGHLKNYPDCGWPETVESVASSCIKMAYNDEANIWRSPALFISENDYFKVYNTINGCYYPSGNESKIEITRPGWYYIEWSFDDAQNVRLVLA